MNNYKFGNMIYEYRTKLNLTQDSLAIKLGVTDKAVSKWETGKAYPSFDIIKKLSAIFNVSIDEMLKEEKKTKK